MARARRMDGGRGMGRRVLGRRMVVVGLSAAAVFAATSCHSGGKPYYPPAPNIVLITVDTLRADHCSAYGYEQETTPAMKRLAQAGTLYRQAYSASATTGPSHAALMTSRPIRSIPVLKNGQVIPDTATTLAEVLQGRGFTTAAFVSSLPVQARFGFGQGFGHFDGGCDEDGRCLGRAKDVERSRRADATADAVLDWLLLRDDGHAAFVWVHLFDPHAPYDPPRPLAGHWPAGTRPIVQRYDGEVRFADDAIGRIVDAFEEADWPQGTIFVVTADHGEGLGDHRWVGHGVNLYDEAVRIPLIVTWKGHLPAGVVRDDPVSILDVAPTVLSLAGIVVPPEFEGRSLVGAIPADRALFMQRRSYESKRDRGRPVHGEMLAVVRDRWKYVRAPGEKRFELYDLTRDSRELVNLADQAPDRRKRLDVELDRWLAEHPMADAEKRGLDDDTRRALHALGYVD